MGICVAPATAQSGASATCPTLQSIGNINGPLYRQHMSPAARHLARTTAATGSRITGETDFNNNGATFVYSDSIILHYSGNRGGDLNHLGLQLKFDNATIYEYNATTMAWVNGTYEIQTFDAANNILSTVEQVWDSATAAWVNDYQNVYTYTGNKVQTAVYQSWDAGSSAWLNNNKDLYTYDGAGNMLTDVYFTWNSTTSAWVNNYQETYTYNSSNKETSVISQSWDTTALTWNNESKQVYTYDGTNTYLVAQVSQGWNSGASTWDNIDQYLYTYDGSNNLITQTYQEWTGAAWVNYSLYTYSNFIGGMAQTQVDQTWNSTTLVFDNETKYTNTYNSDNQLIDQVSQTWNIGGFWQSTTSDRESKFYYEPYTTLVKNVASANDVLLYPVPANGSINISAKWDAPQAFSVLIYDMVGNVVRQWDVPVCAVYNTNVALDLPSGAYFMKFTGSNGSVTKQFAVIQ